MRLACLLKACNDDKCWAHESCVQVCLWFFFVYIMRTNRVFALPFLIISPFGNCRWTFSKNHDFEPHVHCNWKDVIGLLRAALRYVGAIRFVFHVLQLLPIRFTQQHSCCISKYVMKRLQNNHIEN